MRRTTKYWRAYRNLHQRRLADAWPEYRAVGYPAFRSLCREVWREVAATPAELPFFNWHELVVARG